MKCDMSKEKLMDIITKASFAMDDVKLFLDTYHKAKEMREEAWKMYTHNFGPLSAYDVANKDYWDWNKGPMPWEGGNC